MSEVMEQTIQHDIADAKIAADLSDQPVFTQERLFRGKLHVKAPRLREIAQQTWDPKAEIEMQIKHEPWDLPDRHTVHLGLQVIVKNQGVTAITVEVTQSGVFRLSNLSKEQQEYALNATAPDLLFPAARQAIADALLHAGLPPLLLTPVHFASLYQQQKDKAAKKTDATMLWQQKHCSKDLLAMNYTVSP